MIKLKFPKNQLFIIITFLCSIFIISASDNDGLLKQLGRDVRLFKIAYLLTGKASWQSGYNKEGLNKAQQKLLDTLREVKKQEKALDHEQKLILTESYATLGQLFHGKEPNETCKQAYKELEPFIVNHCKTMDQMIEGKDSELVKLCKSTCTDAEKNDPHLFNIIKETHSYVAYRSCWQDRKKIKEVYLPLMKVFAQNIAHNATSGYMDLYIPLMLHYKSIYDHVDNFLKKSKSDKSQYPNYREIEKYNRALTPIYTQWATIESDIKNRIDEDMKKSKDEQKATKTAKYNFFKAYCNKNGIAHDDFCKHLISILKNDITNADNNEQDEKKKKDNELLISEVLFDDMKDSKFWNQDCNSNGWFWNSGINRNDLFNEAKKVGKDILEKEFGSQAHAQQTGPYVPPIPKDFTKL